MRVIGAYGATMRVPTTNSHISCSQKRCNGSVSCNKLAWRCRMQQCTAVQHMMWHNSDWLGAISMRQVPAGVPVCTAIIEFVHAQPLFPKLFPKRQSFDKQTGTMPGHLGDQHRRSKAMKPRLTRIKRCATPFLWTWKASSITGRTVLLEERQACGLGHQRGSAPGADHRDRPSRGDVGPCLLPGEQRVLLL